MFSSISSEQFDKYKSQGFNRIPIVLECDADLATPLSIYYNLANKPYSYLLESVEGGEKSGRYSIIGLPSNFVIKIAKNIIRVFKDGALEEEINDQNPLDFLADFMANFKVPEDLDLPRYSGGLAGYFGYETIQYIEPKLNKSFLDDQLNLPDILLMLSDEIIVIDNLLKKLFLIRYADPEIPDAYALSIQKLEKYMEEIHLSPPLPKTPSSEVSFSQSEFGELEFKKSVIKAKEYIYEGDVMQVVLSQRMKQSYKSEPLSLYRALRALNPSPYMFFYHMEDHFVVGASPEILVRLEKNKVSVRPIAGTRPRGKTEAEDLKFEIDLKSDPKEIAEHVQLMDLGRNDIGRVSKTGTVKVTENMNIERYSHVMHIVSNVEGQMKDNLTAMDVLKATFPAGTVSGAPKVRAMEIINELEPTKRGVYAGAVGYLGFNGDMDVAIAIRTGIIKDKTLFVQSGAGIVADSVPENEWIETQNKAMAILKSAELAQSGLEG
jgi:anthranilate synthase component 1